MKTNEVNNLVPKNLKISQKAFFTKHVEGKIKSVVILENIYANGEHVGYEVHGSPFTWSSGFENLYLTKKEAQDAVNEANNTFKKNLQKDLRTPKDLVKHLMNFVNGETAGNIEIEVLTEKAKELLGIELE